MNIINKTIANRYRVLEQIGEGGMQRVYLALDEHFERQVALKHSKDGGLQRRFKSSAVISAKILHPNIAQTLDYIEEDGNAFLIEEFVAGGDLKAFLKKYPVLDPHLVARAFHNLVKGVAAAHRAGVVHRDLKPANLLLSKNIAEMQIKITDFGIAKLAEQELNDVVAAGGDPTKSTSNTFANAIPYLAPELIDTPRISWKPGDVWAIGAILFEMLCGEPPFGSRPSAIARILNEAVPAAPKRLTSKSQFAQLSTQLYEIAACCLVKDAQERPSIDDLEDRVDRLCYSRAARSIGKIREVNGRTGKLVGSNGRVVFFHEDSVYGPEVKENDSVMFAGFSGNPYPRAIPVVKIP